MQRTGRRPHNDPAFRGQYVFPETVPGGGENTGTGRQDDGDNEKGAGIFMYLPDLAKESRDENYLELAALAQGCGIPVRLLHMVQIHTMAY